MVQEFQIAPLRSMDDFILESARFQIPNFKDPERWNNRILNNLLYYQTNYFLVIVLIFLPIGFFYPFDMLVGFATFSVAFAGFAYFTDSQPNLKRFKHDHPLLSVVCIVGAGYLVMYLLGSVLIFVFGIAFPLLVTLIHASLRLRNIKNKLSNKIEFVGLKRTPMGIILEALGQEQEAGS